MNQIKSNDRMPARTKANIRMMMSMILTWDSEYKDKALKFAEKIGPENLFEILHSIRRWYSGQTMARRILYHRDTLSKVMDLEPKDAIGIYRGFKVLKDDPLALKQEGDRLWLEVTRNHGFSSWSLNEEAINRFSGKTPDKVGLNIKLIGKQNVLPVLVPQNKTEPWFNALYEYIIGTSFRPTEDEYLIYGSPLYVEIIKIKK